MKKQTLGKLSTANAEMRNLISSYLTASDVKEGFYDSANQCVMSINLSASMIDHLLLKPVVSSKTLFKAFRDLLNEFDGCTMCIVDKPELDTIITNINRLFVSTVSLLMNDWTEQLPEA